MCFPVRPFDLQSMPRCTVALFKKVVLATLLLALSLSFRARAQKLDQLIPRNVALNQVT